MSTSNSIMVHNISESPFDAIRQIREDESEYWSARDLQELLGYEQWRRFEETIERAMIACQNSGHEPEDHFANAGKMVAIGSGTEREISDYHLTRYACYLTAMNGDPRKPEISAAQTYFAIKTREAELATFRQFGIISGFDAAIAHIDAGISHLQKEMRDVVALRRQLLVAERKALKAPTQEGEDEKLLKIIRRLNKRKNGPARTTLIANYFKRLPSEALQTRLDQLVEQGQLEISRSSHGTKVYSVI